MVGSTVSGITRCGGETKPTFTQIVKDPLARRSKIVSLMKSLKPAHDLLFENLTLGGKAESYYVPWKSPIEREEELADVYSDLKIGQNLISLVVTLKDYIPTREVVMNLSRCEVVGVP